VKDPRICRCLFSAHSAVSGSGNASQKIKFKRVSCFSAPKYDRQLSTFATQSTTTSPQKHHVLHHLFRKIPLQTPHFTTPKKPSTFHAQNRIRPLSKTEGKRKLLGI
jgi:hypothetical protein